MPPITARMLNALTTVALVGRGVHLELVGCLLGVFFSNA
jgi:hypothetical protein